MKPPSLDVSNGGASFELEERARVFVLLKRAPAEGDRSIDLQELTIDDVTYIPVFTSAARLAEAFGVDASIEAMEIELGLLRDLMRASAAPLFGLIDPGADHMAVFDPHRG